MRTFITVSHTVPPSADWGLDDLAGGAGRVDLLCRNVQAALFWSHDLRADTDAILVFAADPATPRAVRLSGATIRHLNPDERSTASRIRKALLHPCPDEWWEDVEPGIQVAPFTLSQVLEDLDGTVVVPHTNGTPSSEFTWPENPVFVLGDHQPLNDEEMAACGPAQQVSFGTKWLHGNHVIAITNWLLDARA